ncbi:hypothetical protein ZIOFF_048980 [Zingiber officinale]|uniref:Uncharacterized protein n=1 Tax=Zingiber officinale TaxID=94328 RepID=A0A8J5FUA3_ZINOF|nr:hypothetical protein ZIOFF_048980 [Zingiber officinale]
MSRDSCYGEESAATSRAGKAIGGRLALRRCCWRPPCVVARTVKAPSRCGEGLPLPLALCDLHPLTIAMDVRDQMPPTEMAFERSGIKCSITAIVLLYRCTAIDLTVVCVSKLVFTEFYY